MDIDRKQIAILDFGSQYSHLIARRLRELNIFCELYSCVVSAQELSAQNIIGVVLSGGPASVYDPGDTHSLTHSLIHFTYEHSLTYTWSVHALYTLCGCRRDTHSLTHSLMQSLAYAIHPPHQLFLSHSRCHSLTHTCRQYNTIRIHFTPLTHLLTQSITHS